MTSTTSDIKTATAWQYDKMGKINETLEQKEIQLRDLKSGEALIKVYSAALNPVDWKIAQMVPGLIAKLPRTAANDFSGKVVSINKDKETPELKEGWLKEGARIYGILPAEECVKTGEGSLTTYLIVRHDLIGPIPDEMGYEEASGLSLTGLTAATIASKVNKGDRVLVLGGTTSVGLMALQMCKVEGASFIVATCSPDKSSTAKDRGANETVNYRDENVLNQLKEKYSSQKFNIILDTVGSFDTYRSCPDYLESGGLFINIGASELDPSRLLSSGMELAANAAKTALLPSWLGGVPRKYVMASIETNRMPQFRQMISSGSVKGLVDSTFSFDEAPKAYEYLMKGRALGKVVVTVAKD